MWTRSAAAERRPGLADGLVAGVGFGVLFAALGQVPDGAGYGPTGAYARGPRRSPWSAARSPSPAASGGPCPAAVWAAAWAGPLASLALLVLPAATAQGSLSLAALLTSLYPAFTVLLAVLVLREHVHRAQLVGLVLCAATVVLVALA